MYKQQSDLFSKDFYDAFFTEAVFFGYQADPWLAFRDFQATYAAGDL